MRTSGKVIVLLAVALGLSVAANTRISDLQAQVVQLQETNELQQTELDGLANCIAVTRFVGCTP